MRWACALILAAWPARAELAQDALVGVFLHEVAHALIDVLAVDPDASEEDTADALAVWLAARLYPPGRAAALVSAQAALFAAYAAQGDGGLYRGRHAPDAARAARLPCLLDGAAGACAAEWAGLSARFAAALEGRPPQDHGPGLRVLRAAGAAGAAVRAAAAAFNGEFGLPARVDVTVEPCGAAEALYDPRARRVVICSEYASEVDRLLHR